jgi:DNA gyrase inhibitor GyrI
MQVRVERLKERTVAVLAHHGHPDAVDDTRRPLYRHMIINELVGGPSIIRWLAKPEGDHIIDALVTTHTGFDGDEMCTVELLPAGEYAVADYEGPLRGLSKARDDFLASLRHAGHRPKGPVLQVHHMDEVDGIMEAQFQAPL